MFKVFFANQKTPDFLIAEGKKIRSLPLENFFGLLVFYT
jgi:hypothetical protein